MSKFLEIKQSVEFPQGEMWGEPIFFKQKILEFLEAVLKEHHLEISAHFDQYIIRHVASLSSLEFSHIGERRKDSVTRSVE